MDFSIPPLDHNWKEWIQAASWIAPVMVGLFGIIKIVVELRHAREQRRQELRWRKAQAAKSKRKWFVIGYVAGFLSREFITK